MSFVRKFKTTSGATGVQICYKEQGKIVKTVHLGSASSERGLEKLLKQGRAIVDCNKNPLFDLTAFDKKK